MNGLSMEANENEKEKTTGVIFNDGFKFHRKYQGKGHFLYYCCNARSKLSPCQAKIKVCFDGNVIAASGEHSTECKIKTKGNRKALAPIKVDGNGGNGGDDSKKHPKVKDWTVYMLQLASDVALKNRAFPPKKVCEIVFAQMKKKNGSVWRGATENQVMNKCRNVRAKLNGSDVFRTVESPEFSRIDGTNHFLLQFNLSVPGDGKTDQLDRIMGFGHPALFGLLSGNNLYVDATFKIVPKPFYQCLIIMVLDTQTDAYVPVLYVLMTGKREILYRHALYWVLSISNGRAKPSMVTCDFERALHNAIMKTFSGAVILGCLFHWKQANRKKLVELRFDDRDMPSKMMTKNVLDVLTVIPRIEIESKGIPYVNSCVDEGMSDGDKVKLKAFWEYFKRTWMTGDKFVQSWNIEHQYGELKKEIRRTNNGLERYNRYLNTTFMTNGPSLLTFISSLQNETKKQVARLERIRNGQGAKNHPSSGYDAETIIEPPMIYLTWNGNNV